MKKTENLMKSLRVSHKPKSMSLYVESGHEQLLYQGTFFTITVSRNIFLKKKLIWGKGFSRVT